MTNQSDVRFSILKVLIETRNNATPLDTESIIRQANELSQFVFAGQEARV